MTEKQIQKQVQVISLVQKLFRGPALASMSTSTVEKLNQCLNSRWIQNQLLTYLSKKIQEEPEVTIRLKCWVLIHMLVSEEIPQETALLVEQVICCHQDKLRKEFTRHKESDLDGYFIEQVELPYLAFLKKLTFWKMIGNANLQTDSISLGFSELNKIKQILQLRRIFHNYSCYYPFHQYAQNIFQRCLHNTKHLWTSICGKVRDISLKAIEINSIEEQQYMLIMEAEQVQDLLIEFVYGEKIALKLPKELRIRQVNLLKPQVRMLEANRKRRQSLKETQEIIEDKKARKASMGTMDSQRSVRYFQTPKFKLNSEQRLGTEAQIQLLDSIQELQVLVNY